MERDISVLLIFQRTMWLALPGHYGIEIERNLTSALPDQTLQETLFQESLLCSTMHSFELKVWMFTRFSVTHLSTLSSFSSSHTRQFHQHQPALKFILQFCNSYVILAHAALFIYPFTFLSTGNLIWERERERERRGLILMQYLILDVQQVIKLIIETFCSYYPCLPVSLAHPGRSETRVLVSALLDSRTSKKKNCAGHGRARSTAWTVTALRIMTSASL